MRVEVKPGKAKGIISVPSSKSFAHRMVIAGALAEGVSTVRKVTFCEDILATMDCVSSLGSLCTAADDAITIIGTGGKFKNNITLPCRESGSTLRFMVPVALLNSGSSSFIGAKRLFERGIGIYEDILSDAIIEKNYDGIKISGELKSGVYTLPGNVSSQYISGLLFALPTLPGNSIVKVLPPVESRKYIDITIEVISKYGILIEEKEPNTFTINGGQRYKANDLTTEGDWSGAAFLLALNFFGGEVEVLGLNNNSLQSDSVFPILLRELESEDPVIDISNCPDLGPILFACAAYKNGARFTGTKRLRIKESDRATAMAQELKKFGISVDVFDNEVIVHNGNLTSPNDFLFGYNDHRIVMSLAVLCSVTGGIIDGAEAVRKSFPEFFDCLLKLGLEVKYEAC